MLQLLAMFWPLVWVKSMLLTSEASGRDICRIGLRLQSLQDAIAASRSRKHCLNLWSCFIKERDDYRCLKCHSVKRLSAHHVCRKSFVEMAQFHTGNGITLCSKCHKAVHRGFNRRPNLNLPVDAQGGEKLPVMEYLYGLLTADACGRNLLRDDFYYLSDELLYFFKKMQGYTPETCFPGSRVEQAYLILAETELPMRQAIARENGVTLPDKPFLPGGMYIVLKGEDGKDKRISIQSYKQRSCGL